MSAAEQLTHKKRVRGGHKGSATKMVTEVDDLLSALEAHDPADVSTRLTQLKRSLLEKLDAVKHLDDEIVALTEGEEDLVREIEEADTFKASIYRTLTKIDRQISMSSGTTGLDSVRTEVSHAKLPKLNSPCARLMGT